MKEIWSIIKDMEKDPTFIKISVGIKGNSKMIRKVEKASRFSIINLLIKEDLQMV